MFQDEDVLIHWWKVLRYTEQRCEARGQEIGQKSILGLNWRTPNYILGRNENKRNKNENDQKNNQIQRKNKKYKEEVDIQQCIKDLEKERTLKEEGRKKGGKYEQEVGKREWRQEYS